MEEMIITAFAFVFQDYYSMHKTFKSSGSIAIIGTCTMVGCLNTICLKTHLKVIC